MINLKTSTLKLMYFFILPAGASNKEAWNPGCVCVDPLDAVYITVTKLKVETTSSGNIEPQYRPSTVSITSCFSATSTAA